MHTLPRIKTSQEFNLFIAANAQNPNLGNEILSLRLACYSAIEKLRKRPLLIYASKFINALPNTPNNIDISDIDGFTDLVQSLNGKGDSVDVLLHFPGTATFAKPVLVAALLSVNGLSCRVCTVFGRLGRHTLLQALVWALACVACKCV